MSRLPHLGGRRVAIIEPTEREGARPNKTPGRPTRDQIKAAFKAGHRAGRRTDPAAPETPAQADAKALAAAVLASTRPRQWGRR